MDIVNDLWQTPKSWENRSLGVSRIAVSRCYLKPHFTSVEIRISRKPKNETQSVGINITALWLVSTKIFYTIDLFNRVTKANAQAMNLSLFLFSKNPRSSFDIVCLTSCNSRGKNFISLTTTVNMCVAISFQEHVWSQWISHNKAPK